MNWFLALFTDNSVAHSILLLAATIAIGIPLGKLKVANISLGITWILFVGLALSHFGFTLDANTLHFVKEFGLILFVYSIGLQVGPGFFASFRKGGLKLNGLALSVVALGCLITYAIHAITHTDMTTMVGILSGAVTNTPGLGAAQQTLTDAAGNQAARMTAGYAVAYPFGVISVILATISLRYVCRINLAKEPTRATDAATKPDAVEVAVIVKTPEATGVSLETLHTLCSQPFIVPLIKMASGDIISATNQTVLYPGDILNVVADKEAIPEIVALVGQEVPVDSQEWETKAQHLVSRKLVITKPSLNGKHLGDLHIDVLYGVNVTRVSRAGMELVASDHLTLQMGDRVTVVGSEAHINKLAEFMGNSLKRLDIPNLVPIFLGIFLGIILGSIPIAIPGLPQPVKLGLAGGPLIVAILIARYGPYYKLITFTTTSANMMLREVGISLFLAAVGLGAGNGFIDAIVHGGYWWILYSILIAALPILLVGLVGRLVFKLDYYTLMGLLAGSSTNPPALAFANGIANNDVPSVAYATVYPLTMFLRVLTAQVIMLLA